MEASPHWSFVWSIPTTSVISPLIITLPAVEFPWEGMGQRLYARGLHSMKILTHHNWLFYEKEIPASNLGNRSPGCKMHCYFDLLPYTPVVFIHFLLGNQTPLSCWLLECHPEGMNVKVICGDRGTGFLWSVLYSPVTSRNDGSQGPLPLGAF